MKEQTEYSAEDTENILEIIEQPGLHSVVQFLEAHLTNLEKDVLNTDLGDTSFANLAIKKAKYEGARDLIRKLNKELNRVATLNARS
jgi:hypothetical protein